MTIDARFHAYGRRGMVVTPDARASQAGADVLAEGGNALEASVAAAAVLAVVYPHMNGLGGDSFWLSAAPGEPPAVIDASGGAAALATRGFFADHGYDRIPARGPLAANTVAGSVAGWQAALERAAEWGGTMPLDRLLAPAIDYAERGAVVAPHLAETSAQGWNTLGDIDGFAEQFGGADSGLDGRRSPLQAEQQLKLPALAQTLKRVVEAGCDDFYRGDLAATIARDLAAADSPLRASDLAAYRVQYPEPIALSHGAGQLYNVGAPTQGVASLMILGITDRLGWPFNTDDADLVHAMVEATKRAFACRNRLGGDPRHVSAEFHHLLDDATLDALAGEIDRHHALAPDAGRTGDTVWAGVIDAHGNAVSAIHSVFQDFGSGLVLPGTGIWWHNRGAAFSLDAAHPSRIASGARPLHTLNPAMADLNDGRRLIYGVMGGDGQPQSQSAIFNRIAAQGMSLGAAVDAPRWLQGRHMGQGPDNLKLETGWSPSTAAELTRRGHDVAWLPRHSAVFGQAGAIAIGSDGLIEGASDARSDGQAVALT
ncbi:Gamma-glutamyltranspeptidase protein [Salinisphaera shabanensis E1L3A]|uniref:Gamma-glutamyltranspeptidase protein n=1 Tax=Salinisphaera shabanensis E1L3A TaxID=1033802 RepID=U2E7A0_9GAMM|nr:gamma-glutamyltransferase [Salinisphaera shabanensis]ERJ19616.1 Gamma-glutamyltranspeptidase protein [Salinisphaera shabanensis E1L3A]